MTRKLDWEEKIIDICDHYEVSYEEYNKNNDFKEIIATMLGFSSFQSFQSFPNPKLIIKGMGNELNPEHIVLAIPLIEDCCLEINNDYFYHQDIEQLSKQTNNLIEYITLNLINDKVIFVTSIRVIIQNIPKYDFKSSKYWSEISKENKDLIDISI